MAKALEFDPKAAVAQWFSQVWGLPPEKLERLKASVEAKLAGGECRNVMAMASPEAIANFELRACVEQVVREEWTSLTPEERLRVSRHPSARLIGDPIRLPNRITGTLMSQELTPRMGILMTVKLPDGSPFVWEFYE